MKFTTTREIGIDAAHRVTTHGSKCAHLHGHRYTVLVTVEGELGSGETTGMTVDFGFLKTVMLAHIDAKADHGLILWEKDPWVETFAADHDRGPTFPGGRVIEGPFGKTWLIPVVPTAENLAALWYRLIGQEVITATQGRCRVVEVEVRETPNCSASFRRE